MRRQIARLLEPSLQCARFIYDELIKVDISPKPVCTPTHAPINFQNNFIALTCEYLIIAYLQISRRCLANELQQFPILRKRIDEVVGNFLRAGLEPSETMIGHIIEMEVWSKDCDTTVKIT